MSNTPISNQSTPDPWVIKHNSLYYLTFTSGSHIELWSSPDLENFHSSSSTVHKSTIYTPTDPNWSSDLWAPELHLLSSGPSPQNQGQRSTWYIYFAATSAQSGNKGHRTVILRSHDQDPMNPRGWEFVGPLQGLPADQWSIDATVFYLPTNNNNTNGSPRTLYCCYSGWPLGDQSDTQQDLFLARMISPEEADSSSLTCISRATFPWERIDNNRRGINEGPTFLSIPPSSNSGGSGGAQSSSFPGFQGIIYSANGSWTCDYKLAVLALVDPTNPCRETSWTKRENPLLVSDAALGPPFGPGHASFVLEGGMVFCVYHGTEGVADGWEGRKARVLCLDPVVFGAWSRTVCCARGKGWGGYQGGGGGSGGGGQGVVGYPGAGAGGASGGQVGGQHEGTGTKIWKEVENMVPGKYRGYLDKVKRMF